MRLPITSGEVRHGPVTTEIVVGAALLFPVVPTAVAGVALTASSGGLLGLYLRTPGMTLGIGLGLLTQAVLDRRRNRRG